MLSNNDIASSGYDNNKWKPLPRLIKRDLPFKQSKNNVNVRNRYGSQKKSLLWIIRHDWFHIILRWPTWLSLLALLVLWNVTILVFAFIYMRLDAMDTSPKCTLGLRGEPIDFTGAFAFSLETCTTVGYGLPSGSSFFDHCYGLQIAIYFQMAGSLMFNAFLISLFFNRIGRVESRAIQVLFSEKAVISKDEDGKMVLDIQVYDADSKYPVVEAHARLYVVHPSSRSDCVLLRVIRPNDELGAMLLSSVPSRITHHIDIYSPLMPPQFRNRTNIVRSYGLNLREVDSFTGGRDGFICPACGDSYGTLQLMWRHIRFNQISEKYSDIPDTIAGTHLILGKQEDYEPPKQPTFADLYDFWIENHMEVIAVVEGIDPLTSGTFQALHSYQKEDIVFGGSFAKCFTDDNIVDFDLFHTVVNTSDENATYRDDISYASYHSNIVDTTRFLNQADSGRSLNHDVLEKSERTRVINNTSSVLKHADRYLNKEAPFVVMEIRTHVEQQPPVEDDINSEVD